MDSLLNLLKNRNGETFQRMPLIDKLCLLSMISRERFFVTRGSPSPEIYEMGSKKNLANISVNEQYFLMEQLAASLGDGV